MLEGLDGGKLEITHRATPARRTSGDYMPDLHRPTDVWGHLDRRHSGEDVPGDSGTPKGLGLTPRATRPGETPEGDVPSREHTTHGKDPVAYQPCAATRHAQGLDEKGRGGGAHRRGRTGARRPEPRRGKPWRKATWISTQKGTGRAGHSPTERATERRATWQHDQACAP